MNKLNKTTLALAVAGLLATVVPGIAQADVMASAVANITNFKISDATSGTQLDFVKDFSFITFTSTGGYAGTLNGTPGYNASSSSAPVNLPVICVGSGCVPVVGGTAPVGYGPDNSFTKLSAAPIGNYSAADQNESGSPVTSTPSLTSPATVQNGSYAGLTTQSALSHSTSTDNLNSSIVFTLAHAGGLTFSFDLNAYLQVYVTNNEQFPGFATASTTVDFTLTDLTTRTTVFTFTPNIFGDNVNTISLNAPLPINIQQIKDTGGPILFSSTTGPLNNTDLYQLSARNNVNADVQRVPEPAALALLGIGLLGLGASRTWRNRA